MTTKVPAELSSTPSIVDNGNSTALTIDTNENLGLASRISVGTTTVGGGNTRAVVTGGMDNYIQLVSTTGNGGISIGNHAGGIMLFYSHTGALGSESYTQNLRLDTDGLKFGTDSAAASALDDYEEGDWQATHGGNNMTGDGKYVKVGGLVFVQGDWTSASGSSSTFRIGGLPFTVNSTLHSAWHAGYETSSNSITGGYMASGQSYFDSVQAGSTGFVNLNAGERIIMFGTYFTTQ